MNGSKWWATCSGARRATQRTWSATPADHRRKAGAVGLGALITFAVLSSTVDIPGLLAAGTMAILGFFVIPHKRKQAKDNFRTKMGSLRTNLLGALTTQFTHESDSAVARLKEGVAPYTRFIRAERERIEKTEATLARLRPRLSELRARSQAVVKAQSGRAR